MKVLLLASVVLTVSAVSYEDVFQKEWELYKTEFGKSYDADEDRLRMNIFKDSKFEIAQHNLKYAAGEESFEMGINQFSDMNPGEINEVYNGFNKENRLKAKNGEIPILPELDGEEFVPLPDFSPPAEVNWITKGAVARVYDQGKCGSCYSFATTGALEGHWFLKTGKMVPLSMQNILDCSSSFGNNGCFGGSMVRSFNYINANNGIDDYASYPYEAVQGKCRFNSQKVVATVKGYTQVPAGNEEMLKNAVAMGPVAVAVDSSTRSFHLYKSGIFSDPQCNSLKLNHGVVIVGYGTDPATKKDYWLVKNSWSAEWGEKGYMKLARNQNNMCGIATHALFPKI